MGEEAYHPKRVADALQRLGDMQPAEVIAELSSLTGRKTKTMPSEALVRLLRRARAAGQVATERQCARILLEQVRNWALRTFSSFSVQHRDDLVQGILLKLCEGLNATNGIDRWETEFDSQCQRVAADVYRKHVKRHRAREIAFQPEIHDRADECIDASVYLDRARLVAFAARELAPADLQYFEPMFLCGLPVQADKAEIDLVRLTGKPEGTLREIKTRIKRALSRFGVNDGER